MWDAINPHTGFRRIDEAFPKEVRARTLENEMVIHFVNGSTFQLVGSDNYNSLVGSPPAGLVFSEYALSDPSAWSYLMPILEENGGWAVFNSTPRGNNHFRKLCDFSQKEEGWYFDARNVDETGVYSRKQLESIKRAMVAEHGEAYGEALFQQEYYCSFDAAIPGSIFGEWLDRARSSGRVGDFPFDPALPVNTAWDLGYEDATAIWYFQIAFDGIRLVKYEESHLKDIDYYADVLRKNAKERGWVYGTHFVPPDARARIMAAGGKTIQQQLVEQKVGRIVVAKRADLMDQIQAARKTFSTCHFDQVGCEEGLAALGNYHYEFDAERKVFTQRPLHDWSSHGSSAFMTMSLCWREVKPEAVDGRTASERLIDEGRKEFTMGAMREALMKKWRSQRAERIH